MIAHPDGPDGQLRELVTTEVQHCATMFYRLERGPEVVFTPKLSEVATASVRRGHSVLTFSVDDLNQVPAEERAVMIAHELSHVAYDHPRRLTAAAQVREHREVRALGAGIALATVGLVGHLTTLSAHAPSGVIASFIGALLLGCGVITWGVLRLRQSRPSRLDELRADLDAANYAGPEATIRLLSRMSKTAKGRPRRSSGWEDNHFTYAERISGVLAYDGLEPSQQAAERIAAGFPRRRPFGSK